MLYLGGFGESEDPVWAGNIFTFLLLTGCNNGSYSVCFLKILLVVFRKFKKLFVGNIYFLSQVFLRSFRSHRELFEENFFNKILLKRNPVPLTKKLIECSKVGYRK